MPAIVGLSVNLNRELGVSYLASPPVISDLPASPGPGVVVARLEDDLLAARLAVHGALPAVVRRQGGRYVLPSGSSDPPGTLGLLALHPVLPLHPVEEDEAGDEAEVEEEHHDHRGYDGRLGTADVAGVSDI